MIINCNGLKGPSRFSEFQVLLDFHKPDIIFGCESKLDCEVPTYSVFPPTYSVLRKDRNRNGGGVFVAIKSEFVCEEKPTFGRDCEIIWSTVKIGNCKTLHLASYYRLPNSPHDALEQFSDSINCVFESSKHHPNIIVAGDFNLGDINWSAEVPFATNQATSTQHNRLLRITEDFSLTQHVKCLTRPTSGKTLDLLFSSYPHVISEVHSVPGMSDHLAILFHINVKVTRSLKPPHKVFEGLRKTMSGCAETFFASAPQNFAVEDNWSLFKTTLTQAMLNYIPQRRSSKLPWITPEIKRQMRKKDRLHKKALRYQNPDHWVEFRKQRNLVSRLVKESRSDYLNNIIGASLQENPKNFGLMSDLVNQRPLEKQPIPTKPTSPYNLISDIDISTYGVYKQLLQLNPRKACGPDEIPARVLKELAPSVASWLSFIFQQSYDTGAVPSDWTKALVTAIHKKDSKSNPANYRPVSYFLML
ncbi:uncharacterized protein [Montipora capricornis]|uniref:uncharacterized protein n=1 Tax=Montipora capricornis TaxID=246305 RepID=UPI0035F1B858